MRRFILLFLGLCACEVGTPELPANRGTPADSTNGEADARSESKPRGTDASVVDAARPPDASQLLDAALAPAREPEHDGATSSEASVAHDASWSDASSTDAGNVETPAPKADYAVGTVRVEFAVSASRTVPVQLWYPAVESARSAAETGRPASEFEPVGAQRTQLEMLFGKAPAGCPTKTMHAADAPEPLARSEAFPLIVMSHCHSGMRFGMFSVAEQLARVGFVVAAADHLSDTMYDAIAGKPGSLDATMLELRAGDIAAVLDHLLAGNANDVPAGLRGRLDAQRIGILGHSFGSITSGYVTWSDPRIKASVFVAAPPAVPLLGSPAVLAEFKAPALFLYASEDNSIPSFLNEQIRTDFTDYPREAWLAELKDAGHFAFSDLNGLLPDLMPGCGDATRQTQLFVSFTYLAPTVVREIAVRYVPAFFERRMLGKPGLALDQATPSDVVTLKHHD